MFDRFTDQAKKVMSFARQHAQKFNHEYIGTEHILLGIVQAGIQESNCVAATVLNEMSVDLENIRQEVEKIVKSGPPMNTMSNPPFTPRTKQVLALTMEEADGLGHDDIGDEHLLLGLIKEEEGKAGKVLRQLGVTIEEAREQTLKIVGHVDEGLEIRFHPDLTPNQVRVFISATADYFRACGGAGLKFEFQQDQVGAFENVSHQ